MKAALSRVRRDGLPLRDPAADLHPTAVKILKATKRLLVTRGLDAVTLEAIAAEAGVNKAATRYYFGSKAGLIGAIVDEIVLDECAAAFSDVAADLGPGERLDSFIENVRRMATDVASFSAFFDILPYALRDKQLRSRLVSLYELWYEWNVEWLGLADALDGELDAELRAVGRFAAAVADGIAVQAAIHGQGYDPQPVLLLLRGCLETVVRRLREAASGDVARPLAAAEKEC
jgi:AcrR family transcriptional regulator